MANTESNDLATIEAQILDSLEANLAHTLGQVRAFQRITKEIASLEQEIRRHHAIAAQIESEAPASRDAHSEQDLNYERNRAKRLEKLHASLVADLSDLADALHQA